MTKNEMQKRIEELEKEVMDLESRATSRPEIVVEDDEEDFDVEGLRDAWKDYNSQPEPWKSIHHRQISELLGVTL